MQTHHVRLGQLEQGNAARGHAGEVEAVRWRAIEAMTSCRLPAPWRADKITGGHVVRDANAYIYPSGPPGGGELAWCHFPRVGAFRAWRSPAREHQ
jgi:hypothetical protein